MKILFVAPRFHTNQVKLVEYLIKKNNKIDFIASTIGKSEDHSYVKPLVIPYCLIHRLIKFLFCKKSDVLFDYKYGIPSIRSIVNLFRSDYDALIVRNPFTVTAFFYSLILRLKKTKIVFYSQRDLYRKPSPFKDKFVILYMGIFDANWITPCLGDSKYLKTSPRFFYTPFCIDNVYYEKKWFVDDCINIISVGKFVERKNHHLLINALSILSEKYRFRLTIVGEVSEITGVSYYNLVKEMANEASFDIDIVTNISRLEVFEKYKKSDVFILPSRNEPASVSNLEAMSFGLPTITSNTNKTSSYTDGNGFVFKSDSEIDLANKIDILLNDPELIIQMGLCSHKNVSNNHNSNFVYRNLIDNILR